ncbi:MAG: hypothetical protein U0521_24535 [Anaerolineae bacterium]
MLITVGFLIGDATHAARANPNVMFIGVDQFFPDPLPNLVGIQFARIRRAIWWVRWRR